MFHLYVWESFDVVITCIVVVQLDSSYHHSIIDCICKIHIVQTIVGVACSQRMCLRFKHSIPLRRSMIQPFIGIHEAQSDDEISN